MQNMKLWWANHSLAERRLMAGLGLIALVVFLWLGLLRPLSAGLDSGWERQGAALDRYASVRSKVAELREKPKGKTQAEQVPGEQLVSQSAAESGFTLDRANQQGAGKLAVSISAARVGPLLQWVSRLESAGIAVQTISIVPGAGEGTVTMQAVFAEVKP